KLVGLDACECLVDVGRGASKQLAEARAVGHQPAGVDERREAVHGGEPMLRREAHDPVPVRHIEGAGGDDESADILGGHCREGALELARLVDLDELDADVQRPGRLLHRLNRASRRRPPDDRRARDLRSRLTEELELFPGEPFAGLQGKSVTFPPGRARLATTPLSTGSPIAPMTTGITVRTRLAAGAAGGPAVEMHYT